MNIKRQKGPGLVSFEVHLNKELKNPKFAVAYLQAVLRDGDEDDFSQAVRDIIRAQGNITAVAEKAGITRKTIHKMMSGRGDLSFQSLVKLLKALGGRFDVALKVNPKPA